MALGEVENWEDSRLRLLCSMAECKVVREAFTRAFSLGSESGLALANTSLTTLHRAACEAKSSPPNFLGRRELPLQSIRGPAEQTFL